MTSSNESLPVPLNRVPEEMVLLSPYSFENEDNFSDLFLPKQSKFKSPARIISSHDDSIS